MLRILALGLLLLSSLNAFAANCAQSGVTTSIVINVSDYSYLPMTDNLSIYTDGTDRAAALTQIAGNYRFDHSGTLLVGSVFKVNYVGGTSECAIVTSVTSSFGAGPIPNSQRDPSEGGAGGGGGGPSGGGGGSGGGMHGYVQICQAVVVMGERQGTYCYLVRVN